MMASGEGNTPGESNASQVQIPSILFCIVAPAFVALRFWSRIMQKNLLGADDWTMLGSLVFSPAVSILMLVSCEYGFGKHIADISAENKFMALKVFYAAQVFYKVNINMTKVSILLLYIRIFVSVPFIRICWIMVAIVASYGIASSMAAIFQCNPIARAYDKRIPGTCINITKNWYANAGFSIATDLIILALPMPIIYSLRLPVAKKIALCFIFSVGLFVVVTSILRMNTLDLSSTSPDSTYHIASSMWTIIESNVGIVCACLPVIRKSLARFLPSMRTTNPVSSHSGMQSDNRSGIIMSRQSKTVHHQTTRMEGSRGSEESILNKTNGRIEITTHYGVSFTDDGSENHGSSVHGVENNMAR